MAVKKVKKPFVVLYNCKGTGSIIPVIVTTYTLGQAKYIAGGLIGLLLNPPEDVRADVINRHDTKVFDPDEHPRKYEEYKTKIKDNMALIRERQRIIKMT